MNNMRGCKQRAIGVYRRFFWGGRQMRKEAAAQVATFADLPGPRVIGRCAHDLLAIVVQALCALVSGAEGWVSPACAGSPSTCFAPIPLPAALRLTDERQLHGMPMPFR